MAIIYNQIGIDYSLKRTTDPRIAKPLNQALAGASSLLNIGAGTGNYEPASVDLVAVEPSTEMIRQRPANAHPVVQAFAEDLPFDDDSFSHTMTVLSMHHWSDRARAFKEINRVTRERFIAITWDPVAEPFWLTRDYFPEVQDIDEAIFPTIEELASNFSSIHSEPILIPDDCQDGMLAAYWKRPEYYLKPEVRQSISTFAKMEKDHVGLRLLADDLKSGVWLAKNKAIMDLSAIDVGYRLITATI